MKKLFKRYEQKKEDNQEWLKKHATVEGVVRLSSGVQYEILKMGKGRCPDPRSNVRVHYHGTLIDGKVFDSSLERNQTIDFPLKAVIQGWQEVLPLMPVGSKWKIIIPPDLGYGKRKMGSIPPYSILIFEIELLDIL